MTNPEQRARTLDDGTDAGGYIVPPAVLAQADALGLTRPPAAESGTPAPGEVGNPILADALTYYAERRPMANPKGWDHVARQVEQGIAGGIYPTATPEQVTEARRVLALLSASPATETPGPGEGDLRGEVERLRLRYAEASLLASVFLVEFDRPWRPGKSMRRVLASCWGVNAATWAGKRVELFCDPEVVFGGKAVGGTRISRLSDIDKPKKIPLLVTRGKSAVFTVDPLPDAPTPTPPTPTAALLDEIGKLADQAGVARKALAEQWAASHDGQDIRQATDVGGLELLRDDLAAQVSK